MLVVDGRFGCCSACRGQGAEALSDPPGECGLGEVVVEAQVAFEVGEQRLDHRPDPGFRELAWRSLRPFARRREPPRNRPQPSYRRQARTAPTRISSTQQAPAESRPPGSVAVLPNQPLPARWRVTALSPLRPSIQRFCFRRSRARRGSPFRRRARSRWLGVGRCSHTEPARRAAVRTRYARFDRARR